MNCIETDIASKSNALNLGDEYASYFPRFYLVADILVSKESLLNTAKHMVENSQLACSPHMKVDFTGRPIIIKLYYKEWLKIPCCQKGMIGSGLYGVSEEGRRRFKKFSDIISDDGFFRLQFSEKERYIERNGVFIVQAPWISWMLTIPGYSRNLPLPAY